MTTRANRPGPSPEAIDRLERFLLCLYDQGPLTVRETIDRLSEPMSRDDADACTRRLRGSGQIRMLHGRSPARFTVTRNGEWKAEKLIRQGKGY